MEYKVTVTISHKGLSKTIDSDKYSLSEWRQIFDRYPDTYSFEFNKVLVWKYYTLKSICIEFYF